MTASRPRGIEPGRTAGRMVPASLAAGDWILVVLALAVLAAAFGVVFLRILPDEAGQTPLVPVATTVGGISLYLDGEKAGTCEIEITPVTISDLRCHDVIAPAAPAVMP